jgi:hypothetical protein
LNRTAMVFVTVKLTSLAILKKCRKTL